MNYKNIFIKTIISVITINCVFFSIILAYIISYDQFQLRTYDYYDENKFTSFPEMHIQARGIINNVPFDSIILGTSMLENSSANEASKLLGGTFINLSMKGVHFYGRSFILNYLFRHKKIKNVIYSFDSFYIDTRVDTDLRNNWNWLYDQNPFNDLYLLLNKEHIITALKNVLQFQSNKKPKPANIDFFDMPNGWMRNINSTYRFGGLQNWLTNFNGRNARNFFLKELPQNIEQIKLSQHINANSVSIEHQKKYISEYLLQIVAKNKSTNFYIVFPPYYRYFYAIWRQIGGEKYFIHKKIIKYMVEEAEKYDNLQIYGFEDLEFIDNIEHYMDTTHYHADVNSFITKSIHEGKHQLTIENVDAYITKCEQLALSFSVQKLHDDAITFLQEHNRK